MTLNPATRRLDYGLDARREPDQVTGQHLHLDAANEDVVEISGALFATGLRLRDTLAADAADLVAHLICSNLRKKASRREQLARPIDLPRAR